MGVGYVMDVSAALWEWRWSILL